MRGKKYLLFKLFCLMHLTVWLTDMGQVQFKLSTFWTFKFQVFDPFKFKSHLETNVNRAAVLLYLATYVLIIICTNLMDDQCQFHLTIYNLSSQFVSSYLSNIKDSYQANRNSLQITISSQITTNSTNKRTVCNLREFFQSNFVIW